MKKRIISGLCMCVMAVGLFISSGSQVGADDSRPMLDGSYLTTETEAIGYNTPITRGEHLMTGYSKLRVVAPETIYAGGTTLAVHTCKSVKVAVKVERAKWEDTEWEPVEVWFHENKDADMAGTSKRLKVDGDWYYRVLCIHAADGDISSSFTDGLYVEVD